MRHTYQEIAIAALLSEMLKSSIMSNNRDKTARVSEAIILLFG
jgi:hypothetical protein